jgi:hypothetical protein
MGALPLAIPQYRQGDYYADPRFETFKRAYGVPDVATFSFDGCLFVPGLQLDWELCPALSGLCL